MSGWELLERVGWSMTALSCVSFLFGILATLGRIEKLLEGKK